MLKIQHELTFRAVACLLQPEHTQLPMYYIYDVIKTLAETLWVRYRVLS